MPQIFSDDPVVPYKNTTTMTRVGYWRLVEPKNNEPAFNNSQVITRAKVLWIEKLLLASGEATKK